MGSLAVDEAALTVQGTRVYAQWHAPAKPKRAAIAIHGYNSCLLELGELPARLADAGTACLAIDLRGHGLSAGDRGRIDLDRALADVDAACQWVEDTVGRVPMGLVGHSNGGALALGIAARRDEIGAVVAAHPPRRLFDELESWKKPAFHALGRLARRRQGKGKVAGTIVQKGRYDRGYVDQALAKQARAQGYLLDTANMANYTYATTMDAKAWARSVRCPVLGITSRHDETVEPKRIDDVFSAIGDLERFEHDGGHACYRDLDAERCIQATASFLEEHL